MLMLTVVRHCAIFSYVELRNVSELFIATGAAYTVGRSLFASLSSEASYSW